MALTTTSNSYLDLQSDYEDADVPDVRAFLIENPRLTPVLLEARPAVRKVFGDARARLRVSPASDADGAQLVAEIVTHLSPEEAIAKLDQLDEYWWLDAVDRTGGKLCINVDFE